VGTYFGGRLAAAGEEVVFLARGAQLEALRARGLVIHGAGGELRLPRVTAVGSAAGIGRPDLALICVKAWQVPEAAREIRPAVGPATAILPLQNGVEAVDQLASALGRERILGGTCRIIALVESPGVTRHVGVDAQVAAGELAGGRSERLSAVTEAFRRSGVMVENPPDIVKAIWEKFLFFAAASGVGAVTRSPIGVLRSLPETRAMIEGAMREVAAVAAAAGVRLDGHVVEKTMAFLDRLPPNGTSSMQRDIAAGRPSELESMSGAVVRLGAEHGTPTPIHAFLHASLLPQEMAARVPARPHTSP